MTNLWPLDSRLNGTPGMFILWGDQKCGTCRVHTVIERSWKVVEFEIWIPGLQKSWKLEKIDWVKEKAWNFTFLADGWKVKKFRKLCVKHRNAQPVGHFSHCFYQSSCQFWGHGIFFISFCFTLDSQKRSSAKGKNQQKNSIMRSSLGFEPTVTYVAIVLHCTTALDPLWRIHSSIHPFLSEHMMCNRINLKLSCGINNIQRASSTYSMVDLELLLKKATHNGPLISLWR